MEAKFAEPITQFAVVIPPSGEDSSKRLSITKADAPSSLHKFCLENSQKSQQHVEDEMHREPPPSAFRITACANDKGTLFRQSFVDHCFFQQPGSHPDVYQEFVRDCTDLVWDGEDITLLSYGAHHTLENENECSLFFDSMWGHDVQEKEDLCMLQRILDDMLRLQIERTSPHFRITITASAVLIDPASTSKHPRVSDIFQFLPLTSQGNQPVAAAPRLAVVLGLSNGIPVKNPTAPEKKPEDSEQTGTLERRGSMQRGLSRRTSLTPEDQIRILEMKRDGGEFVLKGVRLLSLRDAACINFFVRNVQQRRAEGHHVAVFINLVQDCPVMSPKYSSIRLFDVCSANLAPKDYTDLESIVVALTNNRPVPKGHSTKSALSLVSSRAPKRLNHFLAMFTVYPQEMFSLLPQIAKYGSYSMDIMIDGAQLDVQRALQKLLLQRTELESKYKTLEEELRQLRKTLSEQCGTIRQAQFDADIALEKSTAGSEFTEVRQSASAANNSFMFEETYYPTGEDVASLLPQLNAKHVEETDDTPSTQPLSPQAEDSSNARRRVVNVIATPVASSSIGSPSARETDNYGNLDPETRGKLDKFIGKDLDPEVPAPSSFYIRKWRQLSSASEAEISSCEKKWGQYSSLAETLKNDSETAKNKVSTLERDVRIASAKLTELGLSNEHALERHRNTLEDELSYFEQQGKTLPRPPENAAPDIHKESAKELRSRCKAFLRTPRAHQQFPELQALDDVVLAHNQHRKFLEKKCSELRKIIEGLRPQIVAFSDAYYGGRLRELLEHYELCSVLFDVFELYRQRVPKLCSKFKTSERYDRNPADFLAQCSFAGLKYTGPLATLLAKAKQMSSPKNLGWDGDEAAPVSHNGCSFFCYAPFPQEFRKLKKKIEEKDSQTDHFEPTPPALSLQPSTARPQRSKALHDDVKQQRKEVMTARGVLGVLL